jgi:hypothetical protein
MIYSYSGNTPRQGKSFLFYFLIHLLILLHQGLFLAGQINGTTASYWHFSF